jgi:DNA transposition AAA+ family ATPase
MNASAHAPKSLQEMTKALIESGMSQTAISSESGVPQPTISRILDGAGANYDNGKKIEALYASRVSEPEQGLH